MEKRLSKFIFLTMLFIIELKMNIAQSSSSIFDIDHKKNFAGCAFLKPFSFEFVFATPVSHIQIQIENGEENELIEVRKDHLLRPVCYKNDRRFWQTLFENFLKQNPDVKDADKSFKDQTCFAINFSDKQIIQVGKYQLEIFCSNEFNNDASPDKNIQNIQNFSSISDFAIYFNNIFKRTLLDSINAENMWKRLDKPELCLRL
ncbi:MAG: hypothetical protein ACRYGR_08785 [Janthinobacterium lividum]